MNTKRNKITLDFDLVGCRFLDWRKSHTCVADYNIKLLSVADLNAKPQRKQRLRAVIEQLRPDIVALQEVKDRQALEELFEPNTWSIPIDGGSNDDQELAIVVKRRL